MADPGLILRAPVEAELADLSAMMLRSKAHWGYDAAFLEACRDELSLTPERLAEGPCVVACAGGTILGVAQVTGSGDRAALEKCFVAPEAMGRGVGRALFDWAVGVARAQGARVMEIDADPGAAPFYERMGARRVGEVPSASIPGRMLPLLEFTL